MGRKEKRAVLEAVRKRYKKANRARKKVILDELCATCEYNRKYAIRVLSSARRRTDKRKAGRKPRYDDPTFLLALRRMWEATDYMCSRRLKASIAEWLPYYERHYARLSPEGRRQLLCVSRATVDRLLRPTRLEKGKGLSGSKPGSLLRTQIPIRTDNWDITRPGFMEADTVAHCGNSLAGDFVWSLVLTDIRTTWTECRAVWNKGADDIVAKIRDVEAVLPFELLGFDCDNGSEFLNYHLVRYFLERSEPVRFTRSRPYRKNDNAHVEQKNWAHARQLLGYDRICDPALTGPINDLYTNEWALYQNHFCPSMKLVSKHRIGSRYHKAYDRPRTPYQRVMEEPSIPEENKMALMMTHQGLDPFALKKTIEVKLKRIFRSISVTSNVRQRL